jgi:hypothetical protein
MTKDITHCSKLVLHALKMAPHAVTQHSRTILLTFVANQARLIMELEAS